MIRELLTQIVKALVDNPTQVKVTEIKTAGLHAMEIDVDKADRGKVIGKHGSMANALRTIVNNIGMKEGKKISIVIVDDGVVGRAV
jgi:hypothetical protein